jgi:hypothetical protein
MYVCHWGMMGDCTRLKYLLPSAQKSVLPQELDGI